MFGRPDGGEVKPLSIGGHCRYQVGARQMADSDGKETNLHFCLLQKFSTRFSGGNYPCSVSSHTEGVVMAPWRANTASISFMSASEIDHPSAPALSSTSRGFRQPTKAVLTTGFDKVHRRANWGRLLP